MADRTVPIKHIAEITKSDSTDLSSKNYRALYVGTAGDLAVETGEGDIVVLKNLAVGMWHPIENVNKVMSTDTTAGDILGGR